MIWNYEVSDSSYLAYLNVKFENQKCLELYVKLATIKTLRIIRLLSFDFLVEGLEFSDGLRWIMQYNEHRQVQGQFHLE